MLTKENRLLNLLAEAYHTPDKWVSMEEILIRVQMSSFNQRFQEWRERGIDIRNRMNNGTSEYRLFTHPLSIDWVNFRLKVNIELPAKPKATKEARQPSQINLSLF